MANPQHVKWLEEGIDTWNERRKTTTFRPDFSNHDFGGRSLFEKNRDRERKDWDRIPLQTIDLSKAILVGADLRVADLTNASFYGAELTRASLSQAILTGADFRFANLSSANFINADLTDAKFGGYGAKLTNANLQAIVTNADFREADLTDVAWLPGELWKAKLFWPNRIHYKFPNAFSAIKDIQDLLDNIREIKHSIEAMMSQTRAKAHAEDLDREILFYYRGESKSVWELRPSVMRDRLVQYESPMLRDLISQCPEQFSQVSSTLDRWVLAQHHGLRTRFLDITRNPLVALFHACSERYARDEDGRFHVFAIPKCLVKAFDSNIISVFANFARLERAHQLKLLNHSRHRNSESTRRLYHFIKSDIPQFDERIDPRDFFRVFVVEPRRASERIRAQSGAFLLSAFHERFEAEEIMKINQDTPIYGHLMLTIPGASKSTIIEQLRDLNVSREILFPGLDTSAQAITGRFLE